MKTLATTVCLITIQALAFSWTRLQCEPPPCKIHEWSGIYEHEIIMLIFSTSFLRLPSRLELSF